MYAYFLNTRYDLEMTKKEFEDYLIGRMELDGVLMGLFC